MAEFGKNFRRLRLNAGYTQKELASRLGMSFSAVSMYERGQREPDLETLGRIAAFFQVPLDYFNGAAKEDAVAGRLPITGVIPIYGTIPAGYPTFEAAEIIDYQPIMLPNPAEYFALRVHGDSMIGKGITDGCTVVIHKQSAADPGDVVACRVNGDEATLKIFSQRDGTVVLSPANPDYQPIIIPVSQFAEGEASIYGVVRQVIINI